MGQSLKHLLLPTEKFLALLQQQDRRLWELAEVVERARQDTIGSRKLQAPITRVAARMLYRALRR